MRDDEAVIVVNGTTLTMAQSATVRVALSSFLMSLTPGSLGDDEHGETMVRLYKERTNEVVALITEKKVESPRRYPFV